MSASTSIRGSLAPSTCSQIATFTIPANKFPSFNFTITWTLPTPSNSTPANAVLLFLPASHPSVTSGPAVGPQTCQLPTSTTLRELSLTKGLEGISLGSSFTGDLGFTTKVENRNLTRLDKGFCGDVDTLYVAQLYAYDLDGKASSVAAEFENLVTQYFDCGKTEGTQTGTVAPTNTGKNGGSGALGRGDRFGVGFVGVVLMAMALF
ncbi:hypothetical protein HDV05_000466 [Chytridiales sp. JEL 0842]|nr:hypothetical protein HDV05_000466 [Chytridiales sp. JEL 0842]